MKNILANLFLDTELNFKKLEFQTKKSDQWNPMKSTMSSCRHASLLKHGDRTLFEGVHLHTRMQMSAYISIIHA